jgi:hypothetical protein
MLNYGDASCLTVLFAALSEAIVGVIKNCAAAHAQASRFLEAKNNHGWTRLILGGVRLNPCQSVVEK